MTLKRNGVLISLPLGVLISSPVIGSSVGASPNVSGSGSSVTSVALSTIGVSAARLSEWNFRFRRFLLTIPFEVSTL